MLSGGIASHRDRLYEPEEQTSCSCCKYKVAGKTVVNSCVVGTEDFLPSDVNTIDELNMRLCVRVILSCVQHLIH
jgi:hypothetical protein